MAMKKIPFNIKYRDKIESGEYTVITFSGYPVKIYRWDYKDKDGTPILGSYVQGGYEYAAGWYEDGRFNAKPSDLDLMLVIDDTELLTPLAKQLSDYLKNDFEFFTTKKWDEAKWNEVMNIQAAELQRLAYLEKQKEDKDELVYRLNGLMQDYIKEGKDDDEKEHRLKCYQLFWDALEDTNFFEQKEQKPNIEICPHSVKSKSYSETGYPIEDCDYGLEIALDILEKTLGKVEGFQTDDGIREHQTAIKAVKDAMKEQKPNQSKEEREYVKTLKGLVSDFIRDSGGGISDVAYYQRICDWLDERHIEQKPAWSEEDENIRKLLIWQVHRNIEDETNDLAQSVYDGIKGHDPDLEESIEDWKKCLAWLKSLRSRPKSSDNWKPSKEQLNALNFAITYFMHETNYKNPTELRELYEQLKKL